MTAVAKTVITSAAGATTSTNAAVADADGRYQPHYGVAGQGPVSGSVAIAPPK